MEAYPQNGMQPAMGVDQVQDYSESSEAKRESISPLSSLGFLKNLNPDKKQTKDGQPPKRRGPKPDSKPALTRRQELNRQAQRTHRERKEMYIKALEQEVLRLKEIFSDTTRERDTVIAENARLKDLLASHGISYDFGASPIAFKHEPRSYGPSSSGSISGSYRPGSESTGTNFSPPDAHPPLPDGTVVPQQQPQQRTNLAQLPSNRLDYDQIGIDFVLTLERPCMEHMQYLLIRSHNPSNQPFHHPAENPDDAAHEHMAGHAMMASAPPHSHIMDKPAEPYPHQAPADLSTGGLAKLLDLSNRLPIDRDGEITPIMAWTLVLRDARVGELGEGDFVGLKKELLPKVTCYGFGAVIEEFEVRDALLAIFARKDGNPITGSVFTAQQVPAY